MHILYMPNPAEIELKQRLVFQISVESAASARRGHADVHLSSVNQRTEERETAGSPTSPTLLKGTENLQTFTYGLVV